MKGVLMFEAQVSNSLSLRSVGKSNGRETSLDGRGEQIDPLLMRRTAKSHCEGRNNGSQPFLQSTIYGVTALLLSKLAVVIFLPSCSYVNVSVPLHSWQHLL